MLNFKTTKACTKCNIEKSISEFYNSKKAKDGKAHYCKECCNSIRAIYTPKPKTITLANKICIVCKELRFINNFSKSNLTKDGFSNKCKACINTYALAVYNKNREKIIAKWKTPEFKIKNKLYRIKNHTKIKAHSKRTRQRHPETKRISEAKRRALKYNSGGNGVTVKQWKEILAKYNNQCLRCGSTDKLSMDHIIPLNEAGKHDIENIQPLCINCNSWKFTQTIDYRPNFIFHEEVI